MKTRNIKKGFAQPLLKKRSARKAVCFRCRRPAVIFRKHEGRALCGQHFMESVEKKVKLTVRKNRMLSSGDNVCVAVSGGMNSGVAAAILKKIVGPRRDMQISAIHVDEGVSGFSGPSRKAAERLAKNLGIKLAVFSFKEEFGKTMDQKIKERLVMEPNTYASVGRRWILNKRARELGATKLAMGHNLDAEVEGVVLNYIRGDLPRAGRFGAVTDWSVRKTAGKGPASKFVPRIKPLREIPKEEVGLYSRLAGIRMHGKDAPYYKGMRREVGKFLEELEKRYTGTRYSILQTFDKILPEIRSATKEKRIRLCRKCGEPGSGMICEACKLWR